MNPDHILYLCAQLGLGTVSLLPSRVYGGFHHTMWRLETDRGAYAVKQLSADTDLANLETTDHYNVTEAIAETFSECGIATIFAFKNQAGYLQIIENTAYLVYPWSDAVALDTAKISEKHALKIADILATMHRANIDIPGLKEPNYDIHDDEKIVEMVRRAVEAGIRSAKILNEQMHSFIEIAESHKTAIQVLGRKLVISHGDLDQKNVLWDKMGNPLLIDWESARRLNPTYEIVLEALDWSGIATRFNHRLYEKILLAYQRAGGVIDSDLIQASFHCILGDWVNWLIYNVARSIDLDDAEQRAIGSKQVDFTLAMIMRLKHIRPELLAISTP